MITKQITANFVQAYYSLVGLRVVKSKKEFCTTIGMHNTNFALMEKGKRNVTIDNICQLTEKYNVSLLWLFGQSKKFLND
jgi:transcriptional regulator with XRE-family HTH domain